MQHPYMNRVAIKYLIGCHCRRRQRRHPARELQALRDKVLAWFGCRDMSCGLWRYPFALLRK